MPGLSELSQPVEEVWVGRPCVALAFAPSASLGPRRLLQLDGVGAFLRRHRGLRLRVEIVRRSRGILPCQGPCFPPPCCPCLPDSPPPRKRSRPTPPRSS